MNYTTRELYTYHTRVVLKKNNSSPPSPKDKCELLYIFAFCVLSCALISSIHYHLLLNYLAKEKKPLQECSLLILTRICDFGADQIFNFADIQ